MTIYAASFIVVRDTPTGDASWNGQMKFTVPDAADLSKQILCQWMLHIQIANYSWYFYAKLNGTGFYDRTFAGTDWFGGICEVVPVGLLKHGENTLSFYCDPIHVQPGDKGISPYISDVIVWYKHAL